MAVCTSTCGTITRLRATVAHSQQALMEVPPLGLSVMMELWYRQYAKRHCQALEETCCLPTPLTVGRDFPKLASKAPSRSLGTWARLGTVSCKLLLWASH